MAAHFEPIPGQAWADGAPSTRSPCADARTWPALRISSRGLLPRANAP